MFNPPEIIVQNARVQNLDEIREWANLNDPLWHNIETVAKIGGVSGEELYQLLATMLLKQNYDLWNLVKAQTALSTTLFKGN